MGLFSTYSKPTSISSTGKSSVLGRHGAGDVDEHHHGSHDGKIGPREFKYVKRDLYSKFHGTERKAIEAMIGNELDNDGAGTKGVVTEDEAKSIIEDTRRIYGSKEAGEVEDILEKRM